VRPEGLCEGKIVMTTSEIETETFQLVEECFKQVGNPTHLHLYGNRYKTVKARFQSVKYSRVGLGGRW
jgi:hypothetical protein